MAGMLSHITICQRRLTLQQSANRTSAYNKPNKASIHTDEQIKMDAWCCRWFGNAFKWRRFDMSKTWLVTGSNRGLGRSIVEAALMAGDHVIATSRQPDQLSELEHQHPENIYRLPLDVTDVKAVEEAVTKGLHRFKRIDVLVNNAGYGCFAAFEQTSPQAFRDQIEINLFGVVNLTRAVLPFMRQQRSGHIINISSIGGRISTPGLTAYQSAKWAVGGFSEVLAQEVAAFGVKVVSVEPGGMRTEWGRTAREHAPKVWSVYEPTVGALLRLLDTPAGEGDVDPRKVAKVVIDLSRANELPTHLLLGDSAVQLFVQAEARRQHEVFEWAGVSATVNFDQI
jgi:NAD(P)-dependent dehydrogenase (short-subunit alcohol dehydrogenase family)